MVHGGMLGGDNSYNKAVLTPSQVKANSSTTNSQTPVASGQNNKPPSSNKGPVEINNKMAVANNGNTLVNNQTITEASNSTTANNTAVTNNGTAV
jgi:hypothetical protein